MTHYKEFCAEHGTVLAQCRCPGPKRKSTKPCPGPPACPEQTEELVRCAALIRLNGDQCVEPSKWITAQGKRLCDTHAFMVSALGVPSLPLTEACPHSLVNASGTCQMCGRAGIDLTEKSALIDGTECVP